VAVIRPVTDRNAAQLVINASEDDRNAAQVMINVTPTTGARTKSRS
jgi:hypothetical protein